MAKHTSAVHPFFKILVLLTAMVAIVGWSDRAQAACACGDLVCDQANCGETALSCPQDCSNICTSPNPASWPAPSKPYFMVIVDNSGSMSTTVAPPANSCGYENNRIGHARCAVRNTINAYSGEVNFGLATYAWKLSACPAGACQLCNGGACYPGCTANFAANDDNFCGPFTNDNNTNTALNNSFPGTHQIHAGGLVVVPMLQDAYWASPPNPSNVATLLGYVDNNCGNNEIGSFSNTPLGGSLYEMNQYFSNLYTDPFGAGAIGTPLGTQANGERSCRSINIILITDGDETCDYYNLGAYPNGEGLGVFEAGRLFNPGVTFGGINWRIKTYVIGFAGATQVALDHIANAGGTGASYSTANETQLASALSSIIATAVKPESCNNTDDNCNGCIDEGFIHYCDQQPIAANCCAWNTPAQRTTCLTNYTNSIPGNPPKGNLALLPCTTPAQAQNPSTWLCFDPGEKCDNVDNNCELSQGNGTVDEGVVKCGNPLHCPQPETCNGLDDNCDGKVDEGNVCNGCPYNPPQMETCDGCDQNCNSIADDGIAPVPCGLTGPGEPPNCAGTLTCTPQPVAGPGLCSPSGPKPVCSASPQAEICDNLDNDCNGIIDDGIPSVPCDNGFPNLNYGPNSGCKMGQTQCVNGKTVCVGWVGPGVEICNGIDDDCNNIVDDNVPGQGFQCGINQPPCTPGVTKCVNGAIICSGGVQPQPEVCDGIDNNCNGSIDEAPLADAPAAGMNGCWDLPGNCCNFKNVNWCAPPGANCNDVGTLTQPCHTGTLVCQMGAWACLNPKDPSPEVCDGVDNDCDGNIDNGVQNVGQVCGQGCVGMVPCPCMTGLLQCNAGVLTCVGGVGPQMETCNGIDDDCDGVIDNGVGAGGPCDAPYDMNMYPGPRDKGACAKGILVCNGMGGFDCQGGVGPSPEVCDGIDNDCDGQVDETGPAPDGIDGTANPNPPPAANIGDACGQNQGQCKQGQWACLNGMFACLGGQQSQPETCDCKDNDCDGVIDNPNPMGPPLCGMGKDCVHGKNGCQCAAPCGKEIPCPPGQVCEQVTDPNDPSHVLGQYCTQDFCGDCTKQTVKDANMNVICAPANTPPDKNCVQPPVCVCSGQNGCKDPCFGVTCAMGQVCGEYGKKAGQCGADNCWNVPCVGCDKFCNMGACQPNPCSDPNINKCKADEGCVPNADGMTVTCIPTCAGVMCKMDTETCKNGKCVPTCNPACAPDEVCDDTKMPPVCVPNQCPMDGCVDGSCCDPLSGKCDQNCPCAGVICPMGQVCKDGQCDNPPSMTGTGGGPASSTGPSSSSSTGSGNGGAPNGVWGLATGGGGCACEAGPGSPLTDGRLALVALALAMGARRRKKSSGQSGKSEEVAS